jgi:hypothetical protein
MVLELGCGRKNANVADESHFVGQQNRCDAFTRYSIVVNAELFVVGFDVPVARSTRYVRPPKSVTPPSLFATRRSGST